MLFLWFANLSASAQENKAYPKDMGWCNVKDYGAKGDGITDDTKALKALIEGNCGDTDGNGFSFIYFPNGTYIVSDGFKWDRRRYIQGQSRQGVVIKLKNSAAGFTDPANPKSILRCHYSNNETYENYIENLTVDAGIGNPGAIGIRYNEHNVGAIRDVTIRSGDRKGKIGLDFSEDLPGPFFIKDVTIEGFDTGILIPGTRVYMLTMEHITLRNQNVVGILNNGLVSAIRDVNSYNVVPAIHNKGVMQLIDCSFSGGSPLGSAIINENNDFIARNIFALGYQSALNNLGISVPGKTIVEFSIGNKKNLFPSPNATLNLPIAEPPVIFYEDPGRWKKATNTAEFQNAIDDGVTQTIYIPTFVTIQNLVIVRGSSIKRIVGLRSGLTDVEFRQNQAITMDRCQIIGNAIFNSAGTIFLKSPGFFHARNTSSATGEKLFIEDAGAFLNFNYSAHVWLRANDPESFIRNTGSGYVALSNNGGDWWIFGDKVEGGNTHIETKGGGKTEVFGGYYYGVESIPKTVPFFINNESSVSLSYMFYDWNGGGNHNEFQVKEVRDGITKNLTIAGGSVSVILYTGSRSLSHVAVTGIAVVPGSQLFAIGETVSLSAVITPGDVSNKNVHWTSSNPSVASVNGSGQVTGISAGKSVITATTLDGNRSANCIVTVMYLPIKKNEINPDSVSLAEGKATYIVSPCQRF